MHQPFLDHLAKETAALRDEGLFKEERVITSHQDAAIQVGDDGQEHHGESGERLVRRLLCGQAVRGAGERVALSLGSVCAVLCVLRVPRALAALHR